MNAKKTLERRAVLKNKSKKKKEFYRKIALQRSTCWTLKTKQRCQCLLWRQQDFEPAARCACVFTKTGRNHRHFYVNIVNWKTELTRYTAACGKMCGLYWVRTTSLQLPTWIEIAKLVCMRKLQGSRAPVSHSWRRQWVSVMNKRSK